MQGLGTTFTYFPGLPVGMGLICLETEGRQRSCT